MMNLPDNILDPATILTALRIYSELARLHYQRKELDQADEYYLKVTSAAFHYEKTCPDKPFSLQVKLELILFPKSQFLGGHPVEKECSIQKLHILLKCKNQKRL